MDGNSKAMASAIGANLCGNLRAQRDIAAILNGDTTDPDHLHAELLLMLADDAEVVRGFMRAIQKFIERSGGARHG